MNGLWKALQFLVYSNLWIAFAAAGLETETEILLHTSANGMPALFVFGATLCVYNLYYLKASRFSYTSWMIVSGVSISMYAFFHIPRFPYLSVGLASVCLLIYFISASVRWQKTLRIRILRFIILIVVWVLMSCCFSAPALHDTYTTYGLYLNRLLFMSAVCLLFFRKDETDERPRRYAARCFYLTVSIQFLSAFFLWQQGPDFAVLCISPLLTAFAGYQVIHRQSGPFAYLFYIDGILLLESIFVLLYICLIA